MHPVKTEFGIGKWIGLNMVDGLVESAFDEEPPKADLPFISSPSGDGRGGPPVDDPLTIYVSIPLGEWIDEDQVMYRTSVGELVRDMVEAFVDPAIGRISVDDHKICAMATVAALREQADILEEAIGD